MNEYDFKKKETFRPTSSLFTNGSAITKATNIVAPIVLSGGTFLIAYELTLGLIYYIILPTLTFILYFFLWLSFEFSKYRSESKNIKRSIDSLIDSNTELEKNIRELKYDFVKPGVKSLRPLQIGESEIYIKYKQLDVKFLSEFLSEYENLYLLTYGLFNTNLNKEIYFDKSFNSSGFIKNVRELIKGNPEDILILDHIATGESIKIRPSTSWKFDWDYKDGDVYFYAPKGIFTFLFITSFIAIATSHGLSEYKKILEIQKLQREREQYRIEQIRDSEVREQINESTYHLEKEFLNLPDNIKEAINDSTARILELTIRNENITEVKVKVVK